MYVNTREKLYKFFEQFFTITVFFAFIIAVHQLGVLFNIFQGGQVSRIIGNPIDPSIPVFDLDNNFGILPVILGIVTLIYLLMRTNSRFKIIIYNFLLILFLFSIFFSASRRGLILFSFIIIVLILVQLLRLITPVNVVKRLGSRSIVFISGTFLIVFASLFLVFHTSNAFKNKLIKSTGCKNVLDTKVKIADIILRYSLAFDKSISFTDVYKIIWTPEFNSADPESSWGTRNHKNVYPLTGKNVEIVPKDARGYLLDSTCNSGREVNYCDAFSLIANLNAKNGEKYIASVYSYVSDDFNGDIVRLSVGSDIISKKIVSGNPTSYYDLTRKGIWCKLVIDFECKSGNIPIYISFVKNGVQDFSKLKGYVIFAYPSYLKVENIDSILTTNSHDYQGLISDNKRNIKRYVESILCLPESVISSGLVSTIAQDPIRKWAAKFISEDTTYYPYKSNIVLDTISNPFIAGRLLRWEFALEIFSHEYNWKQKIFGGGFNFLNWYGYYFFGDKTRSDYPHNPFLYILLYSGILGLSIYLFFFYKVFYYYLKYVKVYPLFFVFFIITFYFSFFSSGSPFDPPIMGFFVILPFFIHSVHKKEEKALTDSTLTQDEGLKK
jgi:uncharacterized membrane protein HdeD (DUF308 family)